MAGGGGGGGGQKQDDLAPHPVKDQLPGVSYCITSPPPWPEAILLGFQHYLVMLGTTVIIPTALVPQMGGNNEDKAVVIQTLLFVAGINTLLQSFFGTRLPAVIGGSYTFVLPTISIILAGRYANEPDPHTKFLRIMRGTQGALIVASALQIIVGFSGLWRNVARYLSPLSAAPLIALVGFGLYELGFPSVAKCVEIGLPELILLVVFAMVRLIYMNAIVLTLCYLVSICAPAALLPFPLFNFVVPAKCYTHDEVHLRPIRCSVHYSHSVALCLSADGWRSIQECTTEDPISLPH